MKRQGKIAILVHGGAGAHAAEKNQLRKLTQAIRAGFSLLEDGGTSLDAVERAIQILEDSRLFNAGQGSRLQLDGRCRMDASIIEGRNLKAGAVAGIEDVKNPICVARMVMERTFHVLVAGEGARRLAGFFKADKGFSPTQRSLKILKASLIKKR